MNRNPSGEHPPTTGATGAAGHESGNGAPRDPIGEAIAAATQQPVQVAVMPFDVRLATGRPARIIVPVDLTPLELASFIKAAIDVFDQLATAQAMKQGVIALPNGGAKIIGRD